MSEVRDGMPYVSRLKYTIRATGRLDPVRELEDGRTMYQRAVDLPGLMITVTPYLPGGLQAKDSNYEFKSKAFWEAQLATLNAKPELNAQDLRAVQLVQNLLATNKLWFEDVLVASGLGDLEAMWAQAFSDSLDGFPTWKEPATRAGGLPIYIPQLQWDATIPWVGNRQVEVKMGLFRKADFSDEPVQTSLLFEDGASKRARQQQIDSLANAIVQRNLDITGVDRIITLLAATQTPEVAAELATFNPQLVNNPDLASVRKSMVSDRDNVVRSKTEMESKSFGSLIELLSHEAVMNSVQALIMGAFTVLKQQDPDWTDVDLQAVAANFALPDLT